MYQITATRNPIHSQLNHHHDIKNICLYCTSKKVDTDLDGYPSEYCSDECRREASAAGLANPPCTQCGVFPQITKSAYCGWTRCRNIPMCMHCKVEYMMARQLAQQQDKPVFQRSLWCSIKCRNLTPNWQSLVVERSSQLCLVCIRENALQGKDICGDICQDYIIKNAPCLLNLPTNGQKFKDISNQFIKSWKHAHKPLPDVTAIWKIYCSEAMNKRYNAYRDAVEYQQKLAGKPFPKGDGMRRRTMTAGNEQRRFHGTKMNCFVGLLKTAILCSDNTCAICCIIREGYKLKFVGTGEISLAFQRFGRGLYFSGTSSKSDDYNEKSLKNYNGFKYKAMLLNKVVVGKGFPQIVDDTNLVRPPNGYDSILGEPSSTGNLNYDEVVVYDEAACLPQYLIIYRV
ncbi:6602_t:CDS:2 [Ambispora leptoticha]|uniref:6602_t:CDS:1 n=1 Tax=Ambispora leptoticha TaxID=144679 RepID=A0A9N9DZB0_9GLOM|nr:6602_t:CDS:2 [Ambispora leptoticha]